MVASRDTRSPLTDWPAPAKLNLFLRITGRRADGYHDLQTVFQFLDFGDRLRFDVSADEILRDTELPGVKASDDLTVRAAHLLREVSGTQAGAMISIDKRTPIGGGFGGGSSDAATTLMALNYLWDVGLPTDRLLGLARQLGADVPVFVVGQAAWAEGVGDVLMPVEPAEDWYAVIVPDCAVATADVFKHDGLTRHNPPLKMAAALRDPTFGAIGNDCEDVVRAAYPPVDAAMRWLGQYADARLTGTGAGIFARFDSCEAAERVIDARPPTLSGFVGRGLNRSPLLDFVGPSRGA